MAYVGTGVSHRRAHHARFSREWETSSPAELDYS